MTTTQPAVSGEGEGMNVEQIRRGNASGMLDAIRSVLQNLEEDADSLDAGRACRALPNEWDGNEDPRGAMYAAADLLDMAGADWAVVGDGGWLHDMAATLRVKAASVVILDGDR